MDEDEEKATSKSYFKFRGIGSTEVDPKEKANDVVGEHE
jgi:hypothetical protein